MRFLIILNITIILLYTSCGLSRQSADAENIVEVGESRSQDMSSDSGQPGTHPLSIPSLRRRNYGAGEFLILGEVDSKPGLLAREFSYQSDGYTVYGLIEQPAAGAPETGLPVIILAHGYIPPESYSTLDNYRLVTSYYAAGGFMVVKPDYRGHGRSEGSGVSPTRTIDYSIDVMNLIAGLSHIEDADTGNIFLYGHSMGGEIGLRILTVTQVLKGATLWAAVTEPFPENTLYFVRKRSREEADRLQEKINNVISPEEYNSISPLNYMDSIHVPILVHHGTEDESVPFEWSSAFRDSMDNFGVDYQFYEYPGENHNISGSFYSVMDKDMDFFKGLISDSQVK